MTNHWVDIKNADVVLIMGSNAAENHPVAWKWIQAAKDKGGTIIHVDPRFTRTSAKADIYAPIRSGTDIVFLGGMINYAINSAPYKINEQYVKDCTNALHLVSNSYVGPRTSSPLGNFSASSTWDYQYHATEDPYLGSTGTLRAPSTFYTPLTGTTIVRATTHNGFRYECIVAGTSAAGDPTAGWPKIIGSTVVDGTVTWRCCPPTPPIRKPLPPPGASLEDSVCVFQKLRSQYSVYTPETVERICGTPRALFLQICQAYIDGTKADNKAGTMLYAMGWTQHTVGTQNIRAASIIQSLLGNMGVAGGGINALRGWHNVQGATDMGMLFKDIPGYNPLPKNIMRHAKLGVGPLDKVNDPTNYPDGSYLENTIPLAMDLDPVANPPSSNWWGIFANQNNRARYVVSLLTAWWPGIDHATSWSYLPKRDALVDCSYMSVINNIGAGVGQVKGLFCWGTNPMVMGPDQTRENSKFDNLEWLVVCDLFETETSNFWKRPGVVSTDIDTEVYLLPGAAFFEKKGSVANSGRLAQWKDKACNPPGGAGGALDELEILEDLGTAIKGLYPNPGSEDAKDSPIVRLNWPYDKTKLGTDLTNGVAIEINGYAQIDFTSSQFYGANATPYTVGTPIDNFFHLMSGGQTACGNWLYCGTWGKTEGNRMGGGATPSLLGRNPTDFHPKKIGIYHKWGYSWPQNRRIIYNRASVYQQTIGANIQGAPLNPDKRVVWWDPAQNQGISVATGPRWNYSCTAPETHDVIDGHSGDGPLGKMPFIMCEEGVARLMATTKPYGTPLLDGAFPEHYEPWETPLQVNPLTNVASTLSNPQVANWYGATFAAPGDLDYPYVCTTYRLTEHWHGGGMSRNLPGLAELQPEPFVEMSEELAALESIANGGLVDVVSARGTIRVKACVTKRFKPFTINGATIHEVGLPWHWGWVSSLTPPCTGASANVLTPFIGDPNTRIPETKAFLVNIVKV
ncbi:MAG: molybdopterin-dependent oxidoreductase [Thermodesulfovibrionales bacterium]